MNKNLQTFIAIVIVILLAAVGYKYLTTPEKRTDGQKIGDAIDALPHGLDKAADALHDKTPGEKLGDAVEHMGEKIKEKTRRE